MSGKQAPVTAGRTARSARTERALVTRRRMLRAAYHQFGEKGYGATTIDAIAAEAGVAVQTVYFTFRTKAAILAETLGAAITGFDSWTGQPADSDTVPAALITWMADFEATASGTEALAIFVDNGIEVLDRAAPLLRAVHGAGPDRDLASVFDLAERRRVAAYRAAVATLAGKPPGLRPGLTRRRAADILLVIFSADTYQAMRDRGWTRADAAAFLRRVLAEQLLRAPVT